MIELDCLFHDEESAKMDDLEIEYDISKLPVHKIAFIKIDYFYRDPESEDRCIVHVSGHDYTAFISYEQLHAKIMNQMYGYIQKN